MAAESAGSATEGAEDECEPTTANTGINTNTNTNSEKIAALCPSSDDHDHDRDHGRGDNNNNNNNSAAGNRGEMAIINDATADNGGHGDDNDSSTVPGSNRKLDIGHGGGSGSGNSDADSRKVSKKNSDVRRSPMSGDDDGDDDGRADPDGVTSGDGTQKKHNSNTTRKELFSFEVGAAAGAAKDDGDDDDRNKVRIKRHSELTELELQEQQRRNHLMVQAAVAQAEQEDDLQKQRSSLELRRMPVNVLLKESLPDTTSDVSEGLDKNVSLSQSHSANFDGTTPAGMVVTNKWRRPTGSGTGNAGGRRKKKRATGYDCLGKCCLRPGLTLRTQMMLSFGSICVITITTVVVICIVLTVLAGDNVRETASATVEDITDKYRAARARYVAETLDQRILLFDTVRLIEEATMDRFDGYPDPTDDNVPFKDMITQKNIYPIVGQPMPLEWNVTPNVNKDNYEEFVGRERWSFYEKRPVDTSNGAFSFQGLCDPDDLDPMSDFYLPNCTEANNEIRTGGVVAPSSMTEVYHRKGSDLVPLLRTLFESREVIRDVGFGFMNEGAGAFINYPQYATSSQSSYVSQGCDWLLSPNPYAPSRTIGSEDMIKNCRKSGETVNSRLYNNLERQWCREMALKPELIQASAWEDAWSPGDWILILGKGVYDRRSREFISCIYVGISLAQLDGILVESRSVESETSVIQFNEYGYVVSSSKNTTRSSGETLTPVYDAGLGLTKEGYTSLYNLVDYDKVWDPQTVRQAYDDFASNDGVYLVASYPMPPVPDEYDPSYRPIFLVIASSSIQVQKEIINDVSENVDSRVRNINTFALIVWAVGVVVACFIICTMAHMLTSPLTHMNQVANEIVDNFGDTVKEDEIKRGDDTISSETPCTPKTELSEVVSEFNVMVASFSGASQARSQKFKDDEIVNRFPERRLFMDLYSQRNDPSFKYNPTGRSVNDDSVVGNTSESVAYMHFGTNIAANVLTTKGTVGAVASEKRNSIELPRSCSPLFWWIVVLIVLPLALITIVVAAGVITTINSEFDSSTIDTEAELITLHKGALEIYTQLRADLVSGMTETSIIDLYVATRFTSWLLFGGLQRADSFTESTTGIEECKIYTSDFSKCDYYVREFVCDCAHRERGYEERCQNYEEPSRPRAVNYWAAETSAAPDGDRLSTDYPVSSFSPETTEWWENATNLPGWQSGSFAEGYESIYDRLRVISAVPVFQPLYLYGVGDGKEVNLGLNVAFEADGMFFGFGGCFSSRHVELVQWKSTEENGAAKLRPELCPVGKTGYDPRCRGWYDTGRNLAIQNKTILHVTAPYKFATSQFAQSATMAVMDPSSGEHVGQTLLDFFSTPVYRSLESETFFYEGGFAVLIAVEGDSVNTVIGPGVSQDEESAPVAESVLRFDAQCKDYNAACRERFEAFELIAEDMQAGNVGSTSFRRLCDNGDVEIMHVSYSPVSVKTMTPVDSSDYSRGASQNTHLIYSLALIESENGLLMPFVEIEETTRRQSNVAIGVMSIVIFLAICIIVYISHILASSFTEPMIYLLGLIQYINKYVSVKHLLCGLRLLISPICGVMTHKLLPYSCRHGVNQDPPTVRQVRGSYEIVAFSKTLEALYKIVRSANIAFFAGELEVAYRVLIDALRLFRRLDNKKAIGIACNNIGNTLLAIYREMQSLHETELFGLTRKEVIQQAIAYYHSAIQLGEEAYDQFYEMQGWSPQCLDFMQHLSNRYFNRGLFLLIIKNDHDKPEEIEQLGMRDLQIAGDMDEEVVSYSAEIGWGSGNRAEKRFNVNLVRIRGYNTLRSIGYSDNWGVESLIEDTMSILKTEAEREESSDLFKSVSLAGRLQEIEVQLMRRMMLEGDVETAARIAVRMVIEDERIAGEAMLRALDVLLSYASSNFVDDTFREIAIPALHAYHQVVTDVLDKNLQDARDELESTFSGSLTKSVSGPIKRRSSGERPSTRTSATPRHEQLESSMFVTMEDF